MKAGDTVVAIRDFKEYNPHRHRYENVTKGDIDTIESVSSDHHGGWQMNLVKNGRGWGDHVWEVQ